MRRLKAELKRVTEERDILKKAAVYFAKTFRYGKRKWRGGGAPSVVAPNHLQRQFDVLEPNKVWMTDISVPQQAA